jgi:hypothetical protein
VNTEEKKHQGVKRENAVLLLRRGALSVADRVIDNPQKLRNADWCCVVTVFVMGPAREFRSWSWDGNPVQIFAKSKCSCFITILSEEYKA